MPRDPKVMHEADTPWFRVTVVDAKTGLPLDLTGIPLTDYRAVMGQRGRPSVTGTVSYFDAGRGSVNVEYPKGAAKHPSVLAQLEMRYQGRWETVWSEEIPVRISL